MDLRHLRYFVAVAAARNFTRAAEHLHMAQPPLSRQIHALELELGAVLFDRSQRPLQLSEAGRLFHDHAVQVLERVDEMRALMRRFTGGERRRFVIGFVPSVMYSLLPAAIRTFRTQEPDVEVSLVEMMTVDQIDALKEGRIDVGFGRVRCDDPAIRRQVVVEEPLIAALPSGHHLSKTRFKLALAMIANEPLIIYPRTPRPSYADQVLSLFRDQNIRPRIAHEVRELQTAIGLVAAQAGICLVPASVERLQRNDVVYRRLADRHLTSPIIVSSRGSDQSVQLAALLKIACAGQTGR